MAELQLITAPWRDATSNPITRLLCNQESSGVLNIFSQLIPVDGTRNGESLLNEITSHVFSHKTDPRHVIIINTIRKIIKEFYIYIIKSKNGRH